MKKDEFFERFKFVPIVIIIVAVFCIFCNLGAKFFPKAEVPLAAEEKVEEAEALPQNQKWTGEKIKAGENKIDINIAGEDELQKLPGIGSARASEIVRQREKMGGFKTLEDLMCVEGIGVKVFEELREFIYISNED